RFEKPAAARDRRERFDRACTARMIVKVKRERLALELQRGRLVARDRVERQAFAFARGLREAWLTWPARIGAESLRCAPLGWSSSSRAHPARVGEPPSGGRRVPQAAHRRGAICCCLACRHARLCAPGEGWRGASHAKRFPGPQARMLAARVA